MKRALLLIATVCAVGRQVALADPQPNIDVDEPLTDADDIARRAYFLERAQAADGWVYGIIKHYRHFSYSKHDHATGVLLATLDGGTVEFLVPVGLTDSGAWIARATHYLPPIGSCVLMAVRMADPSAYWKQEDKPLFRQDEVTTFSDVSCQGGTLRRLGYEYDLEANAIGLPGSAPLTFQDVKSEFDSAGLAEVDGA